MSNFTIDTEFKGIAGARAYHAALTLVRSFFYLSFAHDFIDYFELQNWFDEASDEEKREVLKTAVHHGAMLEPYEIEALLIFAKDKNNVPLGKESIKSLNAFEIHDVLLDVSCEIFKKKVFFYQTNK